MQNQISDLDKKIIQFIRDKYTETWGLKTDEFIMKYCTIYSDIFEAVCNKGLDLEALTNVEENKTCDRCCYDVLDDDGDIMEHYCIDDKLYQP